MNKREKFYRQREKKDLEMYKNAQKAAQDLKYNIQVAGGRASNAAK